MSLDRSHKPEDSELKGDIIVYQSDSGHIKLNVRLQDETVWMTQAAIAELFQVKPQNITMHLRNIFAEGELSEKATCKELLQVQIEGTRQVQRNSMVTAYLEVAEIQALDRKPMTMRDWLDKLHQFLTLTGRELLTHAGKISHEKALTKALNEFEQFRLNQLEKPTPVENHFVEAELEVKNLKSRRKKNNKEDKA